MFLCTFSTDLFLVVSVQNLNGFSHRGSCEGDNLNYMLLFMFVLDLVSSYTTCLQP